MPERLLVDTDVLIDFLRGYPDAVKYVNNHADNIVISAISMAELYAGVKGKEEKKELEAFLELFPILVVNDKIAKEAGLYKKEFLNPIILAWLMHLLLQPLILTT